MEFYTTRRVLSDLTSALPVLVFAITLMSVSVGHAAPCNNSDNPRIGRVIAAQGGTVRYGNSASRKAVKNDDVCLNSLIVINDIGRVSIELTDPDAKAANDNRPLITLGPNSSLSFKKPPEQQTWLLKLQEGWFRFFSPRPTELDVEADYIVAGVRGTEFVLYSSTSECEAAHFEEDFEEGCSVLWVQQGKVIAAGSRNKITVDASGAADERTVVARAGRDLEVRGLRITPEDAVNWVIHYLPLTEPDIPCGKQRPGEDIYTLQCGSLADSVAALSALSDSLSASEKARRYGIVAKRLLRAGAAERADRLLADDSVSLDSSASLLALRSVVALKRNDKTAARQKAEQALSRDAASVDGLLAMSYVQQAEFDLAAARGSTMAAAVLASGEPLVESRLAELELALGDSRRAMQHAQAAVAGAASGSLVAISEDGRCVNVQSSDPDLILSRALSVRGYVNLVRLQTKAAESDMRHAICADDQAPLARLGLGLALIRQGELDEGVRQLEVAVAMDPWVSLYRSYLAKGYFEQGKYGLAKKELEVAKKLDTKDPTPWFYAGIVKHAENQLPLAIEEVEEAIALNDNLAVFRSRMLLDQDLAARGARLGQIYNELGFESVGFSSGRAALLVDPGNHSAHRLLADTYGKLAGHNLARVSELLQSQLLQPVNVVPIKPRLGESNLLVSGATDPNKVFVNEVNPLLVSDGDTVQLTGFTGSNATSASEITLSGIHDRFSYSIGQFHYETEGFRKNNDLKQDVVDLFGQFSVLPELVMQAEFRRRDLEHGDWVYYFDHAVVDPDAFLERRTDSARFGLSYAFRPDLQLLASLTRVKESEKQGSSFFVTQGDTTARIAEGQAIINHATAKHVIGIGHLKSEAVFDGGAFEVAADHMNGYWYSNIASRNGLTWTVGASYDAFDDEFVGRIDNFNPKLGVTWETGGGTVIRAAAFRSLRRSILADQTIEPTQVAGFNQFYDDFAGTESRRYGIAVEKEVSASLDGGAEFSVRKLKIPLGASITGEDEERQIRGYLYWRPTSTLVAAAEYTSEHYVCHAAFCPPDTRTHVMPLSVKYFAPSGNQYGAALTLVKQTTSEVSFLQANSDRDAFALIDLEFGYQLPGNVGKLQLVVKNIFDEDFDFQGTGVFRSPEVSSIPFLPERTINLQVSLNL